MTQQRLIVYGVPQHKGSTRSFVAGGKIVTTSTNKNLHDWSLLVADAAQRQAAGAPLLAGSLACDVTFFLPRPKGHLNTKGEVRPSAPVYPAKKPDIDKLARAVIDTLTGVWFSDDAQIVDLQARKRYGDPPRVSIAVDPKESNDG